MKKVSQSAGLWTATYVKITKLYSERKENNIEYWHIAIWVFSLCFAADHFKAVISGTITLLYALNRSLSPLFCLVKIAFFSSTHMYLFVFVRFRGLSAKV